MDEGAEFKILWSPQSFEDLRELTAYIAADNPAAAHRFGMALIRRVESLAHMPYLGSIVPERRSPSIRQLVQAPYRIVYRVNAKSRTVEVLRFWHGRRGYLEF